MAIADWLQRMLPQIEPEFRRDGCWIAQIMARSIEHNPPLYWLGSAFDQIGPAENGEDTRLTDRIGERLRALHGPHACEGWTEQDEHAQDVLTEACAIAWAARHLGPPELSEAGDRLLVCVPSVDACVAPRRLWPVRTLEEMVQLTGQQIEAAAADLPEGDRRIVYIDINLALDAYGRNPGYDGPMTEPLRERVKFLSQESGLGWVLTRPFEWGVPLEAWY
jgi:hypothetical protein